MKIAQPVMPENERQEHLSRLNECLEEVEKTGYDLRKALMEHNIESIWSAITLQERAVARLDELRQALDRSGTTVSVGNTALPRTEPEKKVRQTLTRTRMIQRMNRRLTEVFLEVMDRTFAALKGYAQAPALTYGANGGLESTTMPLFVQQTG
ncbi:MAG: flagellar export chaperone FlgN [Lentisphaerae bacterium]|nr:flagellar export chaperone FlgN [Lentisphaerota bacterium]